MISELTKPTVLVDKPKACKNISDMAKKARNSGCEFRPHFKTHQSAEIGKWFREQDINKIAVSSLDMASYFAGHGWNDISVCVPVNLRQMEQINHLSSQTRLHLLVESIEAVKQLGDSASGQIQIWIEIDTGYHRSGVAWDNTDLIKTISGMISQNPRLEFQGVLTHSGHTYRARSQDQIKGIYLDTLEKMKDVKRQIEATGQKPCKISIGDTPGCSVMTTFDSEIDEIRPGNFIFFDLTQLIIGSCEEADIAIGVACPVIAKYPERNEIVIYGGAVHLSKEVILLNENEKSYGMVCQLLDQGWGKSIADVTVTELSQEHGKISAPRAWIDSIEIGDLLVVLPVHSCLTANLFQTMATLEGEQLSCFRL